MNVYAALISAHQRVLAATGVNCLLARLSLLDSIELRKHPGFHAVRPYPHSMGYVAGIKVLVDDFTASGWVNFYDTRLGGWRLVRLTEEPETFQTFWSKIRDENWV